MDVINRRPPVAENASSLVRRTAFGVAVAILAALIVLGIVTAVGVDLGATGPDSPFAIEPVIASTVIAGAGAAVVYAALVRATARPTRNFVALAAVVFAVTLVPVFAFAPTMGVSSAGQAVLVLVHAAVAVPIVAFVTGAVPR